MSEPSDPVVLGMVCDICDEPFTTDNWTFGLWGNGPIHNSHRLSDDEMRKMLDNRKPCLGCESFCSHCGTSIDVLHYGGGYDNGVIYRAGDKIHVDRVLPLAGIRERMDPLVAPDPPGPQRIFTSTPRAVGDRFIEHGCEYVVTSVEPVEILGVPGFSEDAQPVSLN